MIRERIRVRRRRTSSAVLWASASQGVSVKELRAAIGLSRERLEDAYEFLLANPPLGLAVQRQGDELRLVTAPEVSKSIERHLGNARPVALSRAALEVLAIIGYRQPIARAGIELIRGSASDSAVDGLLQRGLIAHKQHHLLVTPAPFSSCSGSGSWRICRNSPLSNQRQCGRMSSSCLRLEARAWGPASASGNADEVARVGSDRGRIGWRVELPQHRAKLIASRGRAWRGC